MWLVYLIALVLGGGVLLLQIVGGATGHDGFDHHDHPQNMSHGGGPEPGVISTRALVYSLFTFGFVGGALEILRLTSSTVAALVAVGAGVAAGLGVGYVFSQLGSPEASGTGDYEDARGRRARVLLTCTPDRPGKIRLELRGQTVDLQATSEGGDLPEGAEVVIIEVRDDMARVAAAGGDAPRGVRT